MNKIHLSFTPVFDNVAADLGHVSALVFGAVWRYCQMRKGYCNASHETIATRAHVNKRTVLRHLQRLCEVGYLLDRTPGLTAPHTYVVTEKASLTVEVTGQPSAPTELVTESHNLATESHRLVTGSHKPCDRESHKETLKETIQDTKEDTEEGDANAPPPRPPPKKRKRSAKQQARDKMGNGLMRLVYNTEDFVSLSAEAQSNIRKHTTKHLQANPPRAPDDIMAFGEWWFVNDWRGRQGQRPTLKQILDEWGAFEAHRRGEAPPKAETKTEVQMKRLAHKYARAVARAEQLPDGK